MIALREFTNCWGPMRTRIKICGITSVDDAKAAATAGADAIGLVMAESPRQVNTALARHIAQQLPPFVTVVAVFVNEEIRTVERLHREIGFHVAQLHGDEDPDYLRHLEVPAIKSFAVRDNSVLEQIEEYREPAFLLDAYSPTKAGGTGQSFDWQIAVKAKAYGRVILSGGLTPDNVTDALQTVHPWAVDVSSGVESSPGKKDHNRIVEFITKVRTWDSQTH